MNCKPLIPTKIKLKINPLCYNYNKRKKIVFLTLISYHNESEFAISFTFILTK